MGGYKINEFDNCLRVVYRKETYDLIFAGKKPELTLDLFDYTICCAARDKNKNFLLESINRLSKKDKKTLIN